MKQNPRTWIFLRGLMRHQGHWGEFPKQFQTAYPNDKIILLDLPGNGSEVSRVSPLSLDHYVSDLRARVEGMANAKYHLLGVSLGGMVALRWQELFPEEIPFVAIVNSSSSLSPFWERFSPRLLLRFPQLFWGRLDLRERERETLKITAPLFRPSEKYFSQALAFDRTSNSNFLRQLFAARRFRPQKKVPRGEKLFLSQTTINLHIQNVPSVWLRI